jgi:hypothetical protein
VFNDSGLKKGLRGATQGVGFPNEPVKPGGDCEKKALQLSISLVPLPYQPHWSLSLMKKILPFLVIASLLGSLAHAQVTSVNAVGMVSITLTSGNYHLLQFPFQKQDGSATNVDEMFGDSLPSGTVVYLWDYVNQTYVEQTYSTRGGGWPAELEDVNRGDAFFVFVPGTAPNPSYPVVLSGEVPSTQKDISMVTGYNLISFPYPTDVDLINANLSPESGDQISYWENGWQTVEYSTRGGGWSDPEILFQPGEGFFYFSTSNKNWQTVKPYDWP